ncbi:hypothetical protein DL98DRAFT_596856 [Cadophora sp. DSE1049]|nr:hypothetical protein DL98DRAFT_596856 [Cadophora sp. DSE1049]
MEEEESNSALNVLSVDEDHLAAMQSSKQCNGEQPSCARCLKMKLDCQYAMLIYPKPGQSKLYIKALEDRVAELEMQLTKGGDYTVSHDHWHADDSDNPDQEGMQPLLNAVRDLSLDVAGSYVGGASIITLGRALESALAGKIQIVMPQMGSSTENDRRNSFIPSEISSPPGRSMFHLFQIDTVMADKMVAAYLNHMYSNFPVIYSYDVIDLHNRRSNLRDAYEQSILSLIYGMGAHFLEKTGDSSASFDSQARYDMALDNREFILKLGDTRSLTYLLLLGQYCLRIPRDPGAWTFFGLAMKMSIELGLHRKQSVGIFRVLSSFPDCLRRVVACALLLRQLSLFLNHSGILHLYLKGNTDSEFLTVAIVMGRPPSISDHDIDVELPFDVDEAIQDVEVLRKAASQDRTRPAHPQTTMSCFIHLLRLKILESEIQHKIYRVDSARSLPAIYKSTDIFLERLNAWKDAIPSQRLTLVYCMWHDSSNSHAFKSIGALTECSIILYVMTERWPASRKYRDLFEVVKKSVLDAISEGKHTPGTAVTSMKDDFQTSLQSLQVDTTFESMPDGWNR